MQGDMSTRTLAWECDWGRGCFWDRTWTITPGWEVRAGPEGTRSETSPLGTVPDNLPQTLGLI